MFSGHRVTIVVILCLFGICLSQSGYSQKKRKQSAKTDDNRVYLVHSNTLSYDQRKNPDAQILCGNVEFFHQGAKLFCDSAHFYEGTNSFEAFGNVKMYQGDTLSLFSDYAFYDGNEQMAMSRYNVVLKHRESTLYTDSLNYDRLYSVGYFFEGGRLVDKDATLTADWGEYNTGKKLAAFHYNVVLNDDKFNLITDTLYYNTSLSEAHVVGASEITSGKSNIYSDNGFYNTQTERARLFNRSVVKNEGKIIIADTIYHDAKLKTSEALWNVEYTDTVNKNVMTCDYCWYDDSVGYAMATKKAVAIDYSQGDSLYMHADTFKLYTYNINTDSVYRIVHAYNKVRAYRTDVQAVCDSLVFISKDSCMTMYRDPIVWNYNQQLLGETIKIYMKDSTIERAHVIEQALSVEQQQTDTTRYNQVASKEMLAYFEKGEISRGEAIDNVQVIYFIIDDSDSSFIAQNNLETTELKLFMENRKMKRMWAPKSEGMMYPMSQIPPEKKFLDSFAWFDYVRPLNKDDIFVWRGKKAGT
ncbi:MAG: hypothetical protein IKB96_12470, partial [Prevotella sp.]|nr:hypothetical protein [Prevotella sp.]